MTKGVELRKIAETRLKAAKSLLDGKDFDLAVDMMGLSLECALKACICKVLNLKQYPDTGESKNILDIFKTHLFDNLLILSGMQNDIQLEANSQLFQNWSTATQMWSANVKYLPIGTIKKEDAERMYAALTEMSYGIITWITENKKW